MADFAGFVDYFRTFRDEALVRQALLSRAAIEREGTDANILAAGASACADEVTGQLIRVQAALYLDSAKGADLRRYVFDRYQILAKLAAPAIGSVNFTLPTAALAPFVIGASTQLQTGSGNLFITTAAVTFPAGTTGPVAVPVASVLAGSDQQAAPNTIVNIVGTISGAPNGLAVTNPLATAGADDDEGDDSLRARARAFFTTARRGTLNAIIQGALAVPGVRTAQAFEALSVGVPDRLVQLLVSDAYTDNLAQLSTVPAAYATQSQQFATTVFAALNDVRAAGIYVQVIVASVVMLPIILHLTFTSTADPVGTTTTAKGLAVSYTNGLNPGQIWDPAALQKLLTTVPGLQITGNEISSPNGRVVPTPLQALRTSLAIVTAPSV